MPTIAAERAITERGARRRVEVVVHGGRIAEIRDAPGATAAGTLVPGFIDLQVNGIGRIDVSAAEGADWDRLDEALLDQGVTTWCPTLVTSALDSYAAPLGRIAAAAVRPSVRRPTIAGAHLEGPFLGGAPGAHPRDLIRAPDLDWLSKLPGVVRIVTLAAEATGAADAIRLLRERGVVVSIGHSTASWSEASDAFDAGATLVTHLFNGMGPLHHREPGLAGAALADDRVTTCLIADLVHVHSAMLRAAFRAKGRGRVALVTDAVAWEAARVGRVRIELRDGAPRLADGTLAGSALTMDRAIRNAVRLAGVPFLDAVLAATAVPARVLGLGDRGSLDVGKRGDLVLLGPELDVRAVWVAGEQVRG